MSTEEDKAKAELLVFWEFITKAGICVDADSVIKPGTHSEPDIFCTLSNGERVAFELVEFCASDIAATISNLENDDSAVLCTSDPVERTLRKKLHKTYRTRLPIELLCYTNGRTVSPDDLIIRKTLLWANAIDGPFRRIWLLGEKSVYEIWPDS